MPPSDSCEDVTGMPRTCLLPPLRLQPLNSTKCRSKTSLPWRGSAHRTASWTKKPAKEPCKSPFWHQSNCSPACCTYHTWHSAAGVASPHCSVSTAHTAGRSAASLHSSCLAETIASPAIRMRSCWQLRQAVLAQWPWRPQYLVL